MNDAELIIFDYDGVLADTELISCAIDAVELERLGVTISIREVVERFCGIPDEEMGRILERETGRTLPRDYSSRKALLLKQELKKAPRIMPGAREVLAKLAIPVCVASNTSIASLDAGLRRLGLYQRFAPHIFSAQLIARPKPAPDLFLQVAADFGIAPDRCLVIEDSVAGIQAATAAGMSAYGFCGGEHCFSGHEKRLLANGATLTFSKLVELPDLLV